MNSSSTHDKTRELSQWLLNSQHTTVFTGAGMSTESGIPDFRSPGGYWTKNKPIHFSDYMASESQRNLAWQRKFDPAFNLDDATPNAGHKVIADWFRKQHVQSVITQNIDNLHQKSGITNESVIELHGNATYAKCLSCGHVYQFPALEVSFRDTGSVPPCSQPLKRGRCEGIIKTATISFGQAMPEAEMQRAKRDTLASDLFIVLGSSLVVYPAASFPEMAKRNGAKLVILNREATDLDGLADLVLHEEIGDTLSQVDVLVNKSLAAVHSNPTVTE
ncbi:MAG: NAD-dependent deacetylase [Gammaproteobacteria bacterium]|nr:MAG: NAD-dependent deacetylase [Gammaproteobacteria bacterium]